MSHGFYILGQTYITLNKYDLALDNYILDLRSNPPVGDLNVRAGYHRQLAMKHIFHIIEFIVNNISYVTIKKGLFYIII